MELDAQENQDLLKAEVNDSQESDFWADKLESSNGELRSMLSQQVGIL